jgi:antitoxin component YwqK of YwqJK toxin-antitoxin module
MKIQSRAFIVICVIFIACSKSNIKTDSVQLKVESDSSTLVKTSIIYNLGADGVSILDTSLYQYTYDDQRRIVEQTFAGSGFLDTLNYSFLSDRYTMNLSAYLNGQLVSKTNDIYYQSVQGRTDSILSVTTGYGVQAGQNSKSLAYLYYNLNNEDSLENDYGLTNGVEIFYSSINKYYTGSNLDSIVGRDTQGNLTYKNYYLNGNQTSEFSYDNNVPTGLLTSIYSNIPSGGLYYFVGSSNLLTGFTSFTIPSSTTITESVTYQFDAANRVSVILRDNHGTSPNQKEVFTYY